MNIDKAFPHRAMGRIIHARAHLNLIAKLKRGAIIDLVPHHHPDISVKHLRAGAAAPVRGGDLLRIAQIDDIVHMAEFIDIGGGHRKAQRELGVLHGQPQAASAAN
ncbi:MAG: hypothetical protein NVV62_18120 [Terricaulis sp.]|nr:hypothetical protein [Terricaulis sp.]